MACHLVNDIGDSASFSEKRQEDTQIVACDTGDGDFSINIGHKLVDVSGFSVCGGARPTTIDTLYVGGSFYSRIALSLQ